MKTRMDWIRAVIGALMLACFLPVAHAEPNKSEREAITSVEKGLARSDTRSRSVCKHFSKGPYCSSAKASLAFVQQDLSVHQNWFSTSGIGLTQAMKDRGGYDDWNAHVLPLIVSYNELLRQSWLRVNFGDKAAKEQINRFQVEMTEQVIPAMIIEFSDELVQAFYAQQIPSFAEVEPAFEAWINQNFNTRGKISVPPNVMALAKARSATLVTGITPSPEASAGLRKTAREYEARARYLAQCVRWASACRGGDTSASVLQTLERDYETITRPKHQELIEYVRTTLETTKGSEAQIRDWMRNVAPALEYEIKTYDHLSRGLPDGALKAEYQAAHSILRTELGPQIAELYSDIIIDDFRRSPDFRETRPEKLQEEILRRLSRVVCACELTFSPQSSVFQKIERVRKEHGAQNAEYRAEVTAKLHAARVESEARRELFDREQAAEKERLAAEAAAAAAWKASGRKTPVDFFGVRFSETGKAEATRLLDEHIRSVAVGRIINLNGIVGVTSSRSRTGKLELTCWDFYSQGPQIRQSCLYFLNGVAVGGRFDLGAQSCAGSNCSRRDMVDLSALDFLKGQGFSAVQSYGSKELGFNGASAAFRLNEMVMNWNRAITMTQTVSNTQNVLMNVVSSSICIYPLEFEGEFETLGELCLYRP